MRIGIVGAGHIGGTLAKLFVDAGHEVAVSNSRGPETLVSLAGELGGRAQAMTAAEAARFGEVVVVSVPFVRYRELPSEAVAGKVVIDTNNYYPQRDGHFEELDSDRTTSSELLQAHLPDARVVKAFNAIQWMRLRDDGRPTGDPERLGIPISGDDEVAKRTVAELIDQIGFDPVDAGTLAQGGRKHQTGAPAYTQGLFHRGVARPPLRLSRGTRSWSSASTCVGSAVSRRRHSGDRGIGRTRCKYRSASRRIGMFRTKGSRADLALDRHHRHSCLGRPWLLWPGTPL